MYTLIFLCSADPLLGRVDYHSLSDQLLMEMLIEGLSKKSKRKYQHHNRMYLDVCDWGCVKCDADERVIKISENGENMRGSLQLCYIPPKVMHLRMTWKKLTGPIDLAQLPQFIEKLELYNNRFCGSVNLTKLPERTTNISLGNNRLTGSVDLAHLPAGLQKLSLQANQFTGTIVLTKLPESIKYLSISNNQLSGDFIATNLPRGLTALFARANQFSEKAVVDSNTNAEIRLSESVQSVVDENGSEIDIRRMRL